MPAILLSPTFWKYAGIGLVCAGLVFACVRRDNGLREEGRIECREEAAEREKKNKTRADGLDADRESAHAVAEAAANAGIVVIMAAQADACSEADALPSIIERLK